MKRDNSWLTWGYGKKLNKLHAWNAWVILILAVSGILLYLPELRGITALFRVGLKQLHILAGIISIVLLLLYLPLIRRHLKQLHGKLSQQSNLTIVLILIIGWSISGIILWLERSVPAVWTSIALLWHDILTWLGIPYAIYHSVSRSNWVKKGIPPKTTAKKQNWFENPAFSRRSFFRFSFGTILVLLVGPSLYRWLKRVTDNGGAPVEAIVKQASQTDATQLLQPLPDSSPPIGGGAQGEFRIYTVTDIPAFQSDQWKFSVTGLVDKPHTYTWKDFTQLSRNVQVSDFHCVTGWSVYQVTWEGIPLRSFLEMSGVRQGAKYVKLYSGDGVYTDTLTLNQANLDDVMIALLLDGNPIPEKLGGPVRLVVPKMYAYKSVKWLQAIELIDQEHIGYWEMRGYDTDAWIPNVQKIT